MGIHCGGACYDVAFSGKRAASGLQHIAIAYSLAGRAAVAIHEIPSGAVMQIVPQGCRIVYGVVWYACQDVTPGSAGELYFITPGSDGTARIFKEKHGYGHNAIQYTNKAA